MLQFLLSLALNGYFSRASLPTFTFLLLPTLHFLPTQTLRVSESVQWEFECGEWNERKKKRRKRVACWVHYGCPDLSTYFWRSVQRALQPPPPPHTSTISHFYVLCIIAIMYVCMQIANCQGSSSTWKRAPSGCCCHFYWLFHLLSHLSKRFPKQFALPIYSSFSCWWYYRLADN